MAGPLTSLDMVAFTWTPNASGSPAAVLDLARLKAFTFAPTMDQKDAGGMADRYELMINTKQEQPIDFTVFVKSISGETESVNASLDVTAFSVGSSYLSTARAGSIEVTTAWKDGSSISSAYKHPVATRTKVQVTLKKMVVTDTAFISTFLTGTSTAFDVTVTITYNAQSFSMPMTMKSARHTIDREELQLEEVTLTGIGTPTSPSDNSLFGLALTGSSQVALAIDTGGGQYNTGEASFALITKLSTKFEDGALIEQAGQFMFQGAAVYVAD